MVVMLRVTVGVMVVLGLLLAGVLMFEGGTGSALAVTVQAAVGILVLLILTM